MKDKCKHEFIEIMGLTGSLGKSCKFCDLKEEDYKEDKKEGVGYSEDEFTALDMYGYF